MAYVVLFLNPDMSEEPRATPTTVNTTVRMEYEAFGVFATEALADVFRDGARAGVLAATVELQVPT